MIELLILIPLFMFGFELIDDLVSLFETKPQADVNVDVRVIAKQILDNDLREMEREWNHYSPRESFARFVSDKPPKVQAVFWDQFAFMESRVNAGRLAHSNVIQSGGTAEQARSAYYEAAASSRLELIKVNMESNIRHGLADSRTQELFKDGKYR